MKGLAYPLEDIEGKEIDASGWFHIGAFCSGVLISFMALASTVVVVVVVSLNTIN